MRLLCIILLVLGGLGSLSAQIDSIDAGLVRLLEEYVESNELSEDFDFNTLFEDLKFYRDQPLDLNTATDAELRDLLLLNDVQINNLLSYRAEYGQLLDILELQAVTGFDMATIRTIRSFVRVGEGGSSVRQRLGERLRAGSSVLFLKWRRTLEERSGYQAERDPATGEEVGPPAFAGGPNYWYTRYRFSAGRGLSFGLTAERDAGEPFFEGVNKNTGFDYLSFFAYAEDLSPRVKALALGDYTISFGQGLVLHNGFGAGKSSLVMNLKKGGQTVRRYSSVNEFNFFRGVATTLDLGRGLELSVFGSSKKIDGTIDSTLIDDVVFTSLAVDGLHRTEREIAKKNNIAQTNAGGSLTYRRSSKLKLSFNYLYNRFDKQLQRTQNLYSQYRFNGTQLSNMSVDYSYRHQNFNFFGEVARSDNGGLAQMHGVLATLDRRVDASLLYRNYGRDYQVLNPNAFGEASTPDNERGIYMGLIVRPARRWTVSAYADFFQFPWLRFRTDAPSKGQEYLIRLDYYKKRRFGAYLQYRYETKDINGNIETDRIDKIVNTQLHRLRLHVSNKVSKALELRNRVELSWFNKYEISRGFMAWQDVVFKPIASPISFTARYAIFDIDNFDSRIYGYENDILYEFRIPFFQNKGQRYYANLRYKVIRNLTVEFRFAQTILAGAENIAVIDNLTFSSGTNLIKGNTFTELKAQIRYKF